MIERFLLFIFLLGVDGKSLLGLSSSLDSSTNSPNDRILPSQLKELPDCQRDCAHDLAETYGALLKLGGTHVDRYVEVCSKYDESVECINKCTVPTKMFETFTSGIHYMCKEQGEDASAIDVQRECDMTCNSQAVMFKWFMNAMSRMSENTGGAPGGGFLNMLNGLGMRSDDGPSHPTSVGRVEKSSEDPEKKNIESRSLIDTNGFNIMDGGNGLIGPNGANVVLDTIQKSINAFSNPGSGASFTKSSAPASKGFLNIFPQGGNNVFGGSQSGSPLDLSTMKSFTSDACQVTECFLACVKTKMNARCEGSAGSLLSEVFMRPFSRAQDNLATIPMASSLFSLFLPPQCSFLYDSRKMESHRIDSSLDEDLKRTYREKKEEQDKLDSETVMPTVLPHEISPFDNEGNLDDLIMDLYRSDESNNDVQEDEGIPVDTVVYNGPIRKMDRLIDEGSGYGSGEGSGEGSGDEIYESSGDSEGSGMDNNEVFVIQYESKYNGELQCIHVS